VAGGLLFRAGGGGGRAAAGRRPVGDRRGRTSVAGRAGPGTGVRGPGAARAVGRVRGNTGEAVWGRASGPEGRDRRRVGAVSARRDAPGAGAGGGEAPGTAGAVGGAGGGGGERGGAEGGVVLPGGPVRVSARGTSADAVGARGGRARGVDRRGGGGAARERVAGRRRLPVGGPRGSGGAGAGGGAGGGGRGGAGARRVRAGGGAGGPAVSGAGREPAPDFLCATGPRAVAARGDHRAGEAHPLRGDSLAAGREDRRGTTGGGGRVFSEHDDPSGGIGGCVLPGLPATVAGDGVVVAGGVVDVAVVAGGARGFGAAVGASRRGRRVGGVGRGGSGDGPAAGRRALGGGGAAGADAAGAVADGGQQLLVAHGRGGADRGVSDAVGRAVRRRSAGCARHGARVGPDAPDLDQCGALRSRGGALADASAALRWLGVAGGGGAGEAQDLEGPGHLGRREPGRGSGGSPWRRGLGWSGW
jgi:hypothetical protein